MKQHIKHHSLTVIAVLVVLAIGAGAFVYSGLYNIGADDHHTKPVFAVLQTLRDRSIHLRSKDIKVPDLNDPQLILKGAGQYAAMCTSCHLSPAMAHSEIRPGLYPQPPNLSKMHVDPQDAFWVIKHGIKMSAMPAWGFSHEDPAIWSMVAFLQKLPNMSAAQYKDIVARAPPDDDLVSGDESSHAHSHGAADMKSMDSHDEAGHDHEHSDSGHEHSEAAPAADAALSFQSLQPKAVPAAEAAAQAFQSALQHGDRTAVLAVLAPDVSISEGGHVQNRDDYANGHLGEDIAFLKNATITPVSIASMPMGDSAMVGSECQIKASVKGKPISLRSRELLKLKQNGKNWKIVSIQWQSTPEAAR
jgi:mono/diheme cytochrome c family protein/ketosteroid isomerase-like protein